MIKVNEETTLKPIRVLDIATLKMYDRTIT